MRERQGICRCGKTLPSVPIDETPYQFCSEKCKYEEANEK